MNMRDLIISQGWRRELEQEFEQPYFKTLMEFVDDQYAHQTIYPERENIFRALNLCPLENTKVVIIGQDPYHGAGQAQGLSFSVGEGIKFPPSLRNIFKEVCSDTGAEMPTSGSLERWAEQGVLLINATLTVRAGEAASHSKRGWERFTDAIIRTLSEHREGVVYMLWGAHAERKAAIVDGSKNCILTSVHPSPLSAYRGFFGCQHFSKANDYLISTSQSPILW